MLPSVVLEHLRTREESFAVANVDVPFGLWHFLCFAGATALLGVQALVRAWLSYFQYVSFAFSRIPSIEGIAGLAGVPLLWPTSFVGLGS